MDFVHTFIIWKYIYIYIYLSDIQERMHQCDRKASIYVEGIFTDRDQSPLKSVTLYDATTTMLT